MTRPRYFALLFVCALGIWSLGGVATPQEEKEKKASRFLAPLKKGEKVSLKDTAGGWQIGVFPGVPLAHKIVEVGHDYVVLEDIAGVTETHIPIYAIKAISITRLDKLKEE